MTPRRILHVDMDAFYAAIEQRDHPELQGRPVIVGADPKNGMGRGVVAASSYEARRFGVHSAQPISQAWARCPAGVYLRPRFHHYRAVSRTIMEIFHRYTDLVEPLSIDEAFLDVTGSVTLLGPAEGIARSIKNDIARETRLTASVGVAPNKFLAKMASEIEKPDGLVVLEASQVREFLAGLPLRKLWGVGPKTGQRLERMGAHTIGDIAAMSLDSLRARLGVHGEHLWNLAHGRDERPVAPDGKPKSISSESTFEIDVDDHDLILGTLRRLSEQVGQRLRQGGYRARKLTLKLRYADFTTLTRQTSLSRPVDTGGEIYTHARQIVDRLLPFPQRVRLIGIGAGLLNGKSDPPRQLSMFETPREEDPITRVVDSIHERYGESLLKRGSELAARTREPSPKLRTSRPDLRAAHPRPASRKAAATTSQDGFVRAETGEEDAVNNPRTSPTGC